MKFSIKHPLSDTTLLLMVCMLIVPLPQVKADPPPWAPAHGYRNKEKHKEQHYDDKDNEYYRHERNYFGIPDGICHRESAGTYLGRALGESVGSRIGTPEGRDAAVIGGILLGQIFDRKSGRGMDDIDNYCTGLALERGRDRQAIRWSNSNLFTDYQITPFNRYTRQGRSCRDFTAVVTEGGKSRSKKRAACRRPDGSWEIIR